MYWTGWTPWALPAAPIHREQNSWWNLHYFLPDQYTTTQKQIKWCNKLWSTCMYWHTHSPNWVSDPWAKTSAAKWWAKTEILMDRWHSETTDEKRITTANSAQNKSVANRFFADMSQRQLQSAFLWNRRPCQAGLCWEAIVFHHIRVHQERHVGATRRWNTKTQKWQLRYKKFCESVNKKTKRQTWRHSDYFTVNPRPWTTAAAASAAGIL